MAWHDTDLRAVNSGVDSHVCRTCVERRPLLLSEITRYLEAEAILSARDYHADSLQENDVFFLVFVHGGSRRKRNPFEREKNACISEQL